MNLVELVLLVQQDLEAVELCYGLQVGVDQVPGEQHPLTLHAAERILKRIIKRIIFQKESFYLQTLTAQNMLLLLSYALDLTDSSEFDS